MIRDTEDVVALVRAAFEEYAQFLTNNPNAEPSEFFPAVKQWATITLGLMPELLAHAQSLSDRIDVLEGAADHLLHRVPIEAGMNSEPFDRLRAALHQEGIGAKPLTNET